MKRRTSSNLENISPHFPVLFCLDCSHPSYVIHIAIVYNPSAWTNWLDAICTVSIVEPYSISNNSYSKNVFFFINYKVKLCNLYIVWWCIFLTFCLAHTPSPISFITIFIVYAYQISHFDERPFFHWFELHTDSFMFIPIVWSVFGEKKNRKRERDGKKLKLEACITFHSP